MGIPPVLETVRAEVSVRVVPGPPVPPLIREAPKGASGNIKPEQGENIMKRLIATLAVVDMLGMAGNALALEKKINIFNGAEYDFYTLYLSPTNANDWEENLLKQETLPNGDTVDVQVSRTEKAEAWDVKVTDKNGNSMTWVGLPLDKSGQITLLPDGQYNIR